MITQIIIAGFGLGLLSSFHCIGMCGPLALALPIHHYSPLKRMLALTLYHNGRILTYTILGIVLGLSSSSLILVGWQQAISIISGIFILIATVYYYWISKRWQPSFMNRYHVLVQKMMSSFLKSEHPLAFLGLGMANGLLPCGMVYVAVAGALTTGTVFGGGLFMLSYGLATVPAMVLLTWAGLRVDVSVRNQLKKLMPVMISAVAIILILRGLNLGIPFISPALASHQGDAILCH